jgi:hypothetical protein
LDCIDYSEKNKIRQTKNMEILNEST